MYSHLGYEYLESRIHSDNRTQKELNSIRKSEKIATKKLIIYVRAFTVIEHTAALICSGH